MDSLHNWSKEQFNTVFVDSEHTWDYINNYKNADFLDTLPYHHLPFIKATRAVAFEMTDESMSYDFAGIHKGDYLICDKLVNKVQSLKEGHVYILVTKETILVRRLIIRSDKLRFGSDHPDIPDLEYDKKDILETWEASYVLSANLHPPIKVNERISFLEGKLDDMADRLIRLEKTRKI